MKISSEKQAGVRAYASIGENEAQLCSLNFHVLAGERCLEVHMRVDNVNTA